MPAKGLFERSIKAPRPDGSTKRDVSEKGAEFFVLLVEMPLLGATSSWSFSTEWMNRIDYQEIPGRTIYQG